MMAPRVVLVGVGMVADLHVRAARLGNHLQIVGLFDLDGVRMQRRSEEWGIPGRKSLEEILGDDEVDAVLVLTPVESHARIAIHSLRAGKHVLVEKPVASVDDIRAIAQAAQDAGTVCFPGHNYAYEADFTRLRALVKSGDLGKLRALFIHYVIAHPEEVARHYDGVLAEVMVHHTYLTLALLGTPHMISAGVADDQWADHDAEDQAWMTWEYPGGLTAHLFATFAVDDETSTPWMFTVKALGTNGGTTYDWRSAGYRRPLGTLAFAVPAYENSYVYEQEAFAAAIRGEQTRIVSGLQDALLTQQLIDLAYESAHSGQRIRVSDRIPMAGAILR